MYWKWKKMFFKYLSVIDLRFKSEIFHNTGKDASGQAIMPQVALPHSCELGRWEAEHRKNDLINL